MVAIYRGSLKGTYYKSSEETQIVVCRSLYFSGVDPFTPTYTHMAGNDWINSYLEAIIESEPGFEDAKGGSLLLRERGRFSPTRYFVNNVIGFDDTDLHRSWLRVCVSS